MTNKSKGKIGFSNGVSLDIPNVLQSRPHGLRYSLCLDSFLLDLVSFSRLHHLVCGGNSQLCIFTGYPHHLEYSSQGIHIIDRRPLEWRDSPDLFYIILRLPCCLSVITLCLGIGTHALPTKCIVDLLYPLLVVSKFTGLLARWG